MEEMDTLFNHQLDALIALEDGTCLLGNSIGIKGITTGEIVFNTSITGYQEIITDPSYCGQIITFTTAHIGNIGTNHDDNQSQRIWATGLVISNTQIYCSNWRNEINFNDFLVEHGVVAIAGVDTRKLTRHIREHGSLYACIMSGNINSEIAIQHAKKRTCVHDLAYQVSGEKIHSLRTNKIKDSSLTKRDIPHIVVFDLGVKNSILKKLIMFHCKVTVIPCDTSFETLLKLDADGIVISNGPGDPQKLENIILIIKKILDLNIPLLGICLGCQLLSLANGAKTFKMKYGHHGSNHPVINLHTKKIFITTQNHGYAIDESTIVDTIEITHRSLFDNTIQGIRILKKNAIGFQGHPEGHPGPEELDLLFQDFIRAAKDHLCQKTKVLEMF